MMRRVLTGGFLAACLATTGCAGAAHSSPGSLVGDAAGVANASPVATASTSAASGPAASVAEAWVVPGADPQADEAIWVRDGGTPVEVGTGTGFRQVDTGHLGGLAVTAFSSTTGSTNLIVDRNSSIRAGAISAAAHPAVLVNASGLLVQQGTTVRAENLPATRSAAGEPAITATYSLPTLPAQKTDPGQKGIPASNQTTVNAYVTDSAGRTTAVVSNGQAVAFQNESSGVVTRLAADYGFVGAAATDPNGMLLLIAWRPDAAGATIHLLRVDPATGTVASDVDSGIGIDRSLSTLFVPTASGPVAFLASGDESAVHAVLYRSVDPAAKPVTLPDGVGLYASRDAGDLVYVFGGPARNVVSTVNVTTGAVTPVPALTAPAGSFVVAVAAG